MGLYGKAERELLQLYRTLKNNSAEKLNLTELTGGLAYVYEKLNVYDKALTYYKESLTQCETAYGHNSLGCAVIQNNIAGIYLKQGHVKSSIIEYENFIKNIKELGKINNPVYLIALNNLASAYRQNNQYELALQYFNEVYSILERRALLQDDLAATVMNNIAVTYTLKGEYVKATEYFEKVLLIKERAYGINSPATIDVVENLAIAYWVLKKYTLALPLFQKSLASAIKEVKYIFPNLTETEQVQFYQHQKENFERFNTLVVQSANTHPEFLVYMFNNQLLLKSLVFFTNKKRRNLIHTKDYESLRTLVELAQTKGVQLGHFYQMPIAELESLGISLKKKETEIDSLQKVIRFSMRDEDRVEPDINWNDILQSLKTDEALVDIIRFRKYDVLSSKSDVAAKRISIGFTDSVYYAILITSSETKNNPKLVLLKNGASLEKRNLSYYRAALNFDVDDMVSYSEYWKPFEASIKGKRKIYISADGVYNQINLNAIHDENGKYILEKYDLQSILNSGQLLNRKGESAVDFSNVVLMGDPIFDIKQPYVFESSQSSKYEALPATLNEINGIADILKRNGAHVDTYLKQMATEENLKKIKSPSILHIATHGFFSTNLVYLNEKVKNDFLFHSGIILSGSKTSTSENAFENDGIVTAYDVMNLELTNTDLVVLSACETGLGKIENGEGVYGLQRSFLQAGARDILISLWKVEDEVTKDLMIKFYSYLSQRVDKREAFKRAQLDMLHKVNNPRLWAGFVVISGD